MTTQKPTNVAAAAPVPTAAPVAIKPAAPARAPRVVKTASVAKAPAKPAAAAAKVKAAPLKKVTVAPKVKTEIKPVAKPEKNLPKPAPKAKPVKAAAAVKPVSPVKAAKPAKAAKPVAVAEVKIKKIKQIRDSFTMPESEYAVIADVKRVSLKAGFEIKKSDLLRIGIQLIKGLDVAKLKELHGKLLPLKAGRPKK
ncbi:hypothetical protein RGU70_15265 [Herbaspirillum sp. RTI4]|uniref:hypothetical protein n=1 Tax=Herbaspirillum sp. RTI4 TaxID=3048640 RepID=UPI002AB4B7F5|nr:hypothetical protein [Herbaspirillum sp. RTI4]MDY7579674.1 hypothetical protein [Herbaspirillum sp. RTI4]MEA9981889.1 hypothetical protein [Herbaspirillum sp. RTI4]